MLGDVRLMFVLYYRHGTGRSRGVLCGGLRQRQATVPHRGVHDLIRHDGHVHDRHGLHVSAVAVFRQMHAYVLDEGVEVGRPGLVFVLQRVPLVVALQVTGGHGVGGVVKVRERGRRLFDLCLSTSGLPLFVRGFHRRIGAVMAREMLLHFVRSGGLVVAFLALVRFFFEVDFLMPHQVALLNEGFVTGRADVLADVQVTLHVAF